MINKFNPDTRVYVLENGDIRKGIIKKVYNEVEISIVEFEDGNVEKVHYSKLELLPEKKVQDNQDPKEPVEKSEITITPDEFRKIATKVIAKIHKELFYDEGNND